MSLVGASASITDCSVSIKVIESDHAWDVAKSANFQNTVDKIELELARYLRPQVVQMAASGAGVEVDGAAKTNAVAMLGSVYNSKVQYEEVRILYIGLMSETPNNIGDNLYTKLIDRLISGFAADQAEQDALIETLFKIVLATHEALRELEGKVGQEVYMKPFLRVFHERKPQYRIFFAILTLCVLMKDDLGERSKDRTKELERMRKFIRRARHIVDVERSSFVATYAHAVAAMAAEAWGGTSDENRLRQSLSGILKRGFKGMYGSLSMKIDLMQKIGPAG